MKNKAHLTKPGLEQLKKIKSGMNTGRNYPTLDTNRELGSYPTHEPRSFEGAREVSNNLSLNTVLHKKGFHTHAKAAKRVGLLSGGEVNLNHKYIEGTRLFYRQSDNYLIWRDILLKVNSKAHLTSEGLNQIKELRSKLNKYPGPDGLNSHFITPKIDPRGFRSYSTKPYNNVNYLGPKPDEGENLKRLSPYLAGLIEGDGHIAVHDKNSKAKKYLALPTKNNYSV